MPLSRDFAATIRPDPRARTWVTTTGVSACLAGFFLIAGLDIGAAWRLLLAVCWCADGVISLSRFRRAASKLVAIRIGPGGLEILRRDGLRTGARLLSGTTVMRRLAWLRMAGADGIRYQELIRAKRTDPAEWHRLQLVWQLRDGGFGHTGAA
jgi:hypothetical protein